MARGQAIMVNTRPKVFTESILLRLTLDEARDVYGCMADGETKAAFLRCALHRELEARGCHGHGDITMGMVHEDIRMAHATEAAEAATRATPRALWGDED